MAFSVIVECLNLRLAFVSSSNIYIYLMQTCGGTRASSTGSTSLRMAAPVAARLAASPAWPRMERPSSTMEDSASAWPATCT